MKKLLGWLALAIAAMWLVKNPTGRRPGPADRPALSTLAAAL